MRLARSNAVLRLVILSCNLLVCWQSTTIYWYCWQSTKVSIVAYCHTMSDSSHCLQLHMQTVKARTARHRYVTVCSRIDGCTLVYQLYLKAKAKATALSSQYQAHYYPGTCQRHPDNQVSACQITVSYATDVAGLVPGSGYHRSQIEFQLQLTCSNHAVSQERSS